MGGGPRGYRLAVRLTGWLMRTHRHRLWRPGLLAQRCWADAPWTRRWPPRLRSGRVIRAEYRGETVAAKEMEIGRDLDAKEAFISEAQQVRGGTAAGGWGWGRGWGRSALVPERRRRGRGRLRAATTAAAAAARACATCRLAQLCNLRHPNVVTFYGCVVERTTGVLLTELCEGACGTSLAVPPAWWRRAPPSACPRRCLACLPPPPPTPSDVIRCAPCRPRPGVGAAPAGRRRAARVWLAAPRLPGGLRGQQGAQLPAQPRHRAHGEEGWGMAEWEGVVLEAGSCSQPAR